MSENSERDYGLVKSFGIDDGELAGNSMQECFVMGYELAQIDALVKGTEPFSRPVHAANKDRIIKSFQDTGRKFDLKWMPEDVSETWMWLDCPKPNN